MLHRTLVSGAAGFIGSHLCERLINDGHEVVGIDNLSVGRMSNIEHLDKNKFTFFNADIERYGDKIEELFTGIDWFFHLAARADIVPSIVDPYEYHRSNVTGTVRVLEAARAKKVKRFIYAASSSCYGIPDEYPTKETADIRPEYPYALTKYLGEQCVMHWDKVYDLPCVSLRLFNVYGPRSRTAGTYGAVFGVFLSQIYHGKAPTIVGDGRQSRDFTFVTDVVDAFVRAAESDIRGEVFNVGTGQPKSINYLVECLGAKIVEFIPERPGEPKCTHADSSKINLWLDWSHSTQFEEGVKSMLEHINDFRDAPLWTAEKIKDATAVWFQHLGKTNA